MKCSRSLVALVVAGALGAGCTSGDSAKEPTTTAPVATAAAATTAPPPQTETAAPTEVPAPTEPTATEAPAPTDAPDPYPGVTGDAPGVTDDTIKIGVTYVDVAALKASGLEFDLGPFDAAYQAYAKYINDNGGINGRKLEVVTVGLDPSMPEAADAACVQLTEDEDVFIVAGFWRLGSGCVTDVHATALVGGSPNPEELAAAKAPWITPNPDSEVGTFVIKRLLDEGALSGTLGVLGQVDEQGALDVAIDALTEAGITPAEVATIDAPPDDTAAVKAAVQAISERFKAKGVDVLLLAGAAPGTQWLTHMNGDAAYRPKLRFTAYNAPQAFYANAANADADFTVLEDSLIGGLYGPDQARFEEQGMQDCMAVVAKAGVVAPEPKTTSGELGDQPYQAAFEACWHLAIIQGWATKAGPNLNYGTLAAALADGLELTVPGDPKPRVFGPGGAADGDPQAFLYSWDVKAAAPVLAE